MEIIILADLIVHIYKMLQRAPSLSDVTVEEMCFQCKLNTETVLLRQMYGKQNIASMVNKVYVHVYRTLSELNIMIKNIKYNGNNTSGFNGGPLLKCLNVSLAGEYNTLLGNNHSLLCTSGKWRYS